MSVRPDPFIQSIPIVPIHPLHGHLAYRPDSAAKGGQKTLTIQVIVENRFTLVPAIQGLG